MAGPMLCACWVKYKPGTLWKASKRDWRKKRKNCGKESMYLQLNRLKD